MAKLPNALRDQIMTAFRWRVFDKMGVVPFPHQAEWMLASDGLTLTDTPWSESAPEGASKITVRLGDESLADRVALPRVAGRARVLADLGAFKVGKSFGAGMWSTGFAALPDGRVSLVGLEYDICAPEFEYIIEALLSERGMGMKFDSLQNRPRDGRMWLDLPNGFRLDARSWERKDTLKGKEVDAYVFCEAFMLPDLSCYTGVKQNLAARDGYALFPTTPDRPWVQDLHDRGHGGNPDFAEWHCTCGVPRSVNPHTYSAREMDQANPDKGGLMTREQFAISYLGKLGDFVGRCYNYQRGQATFGVGSHPGLWKDPEGAAVPGNLAIPNGWEVLGAADTGTFMTGLLAAFDPDGTAFILYEQPNYRYVSHKPELDETSSIPRWANTMRAAMDAFQCRGLYADRNSQYKSEFQNNHGIHLLPAAANLQTRTEIAREYFQQGKILLAPWLSVLPFELENAQWPEEATAAGRFERMKRLDHTLDCLEHILARRPRGIQPRDAEPRLWIEEYLGRSIRKPKSVPNHLGGQ